MPALALISSDPTLYQMLTAALAGGAWSVEWLAPDRAAEGVLQQEVVVLDAADPRAMD